MYEYHNNTLSIPAKVLYEDLELMSYDSYKRKCKSGKLVRTREGKGLGSQALVSYNDLPADIKNIVTEKYGNPYQAATQNQLKNYIVPDMAAFKYFSEYRKPNGQPLGEDKKKELATNCLILNAIQTVLNSKGSKSKAMGNKSTKVWQILSEAVNNLSTIEYTHSLPGNERSLQRRYNSYLKNSYSDFIHGGMGAENSTKIKGEVHDFLLATYCLPNKPTVPMVITKYNQVRKEKGFPSITEAAVNLWLEKPEIKRVWMLARHGKDEWTKHFGHHVKRDRQNWFPNVYWAIDGSKLDWIHYDDTSSNKMGAKLKINPVIDVYSEKILGWSFSETENHTDHIKAVKMALQEAQNRPYLFTYDQQSGHKMKRMQELYNNIIAQKGGTHYPHKVGRKSSPVDHLFNRLQQQVVNQMWFSDGQSVTVRDNDNKPNTDFVYENRERLYKKEELQKAWEFCVKEWNEAEHPNFKGQSRNEVYQHAAAMSEPISLLDMISAVWVEETKQITYKRGGLVMRVAGKEYEYEVYDDAGKIDLEFRRQYVGAKFVVRYDPEYLNDYVQLYQVGTNKELLLITHAEPKRKHENIPALMLEGDKERWFQDFQAQEQELQRDWKEYQRLVESSGISRESLIEEQDLMIKFGSKITKDERNKAEKVTAFSRL